MNLFQSLREYEQFIYTIQLRYSRITTSTLVVVHRSADVAIIRGELVFNNDIRLLVWERISLEYGDLQIETYGYEVWLHDNKLYWYDSQAHPNNPLLAATHPHHKHVPPDIKHNRIPAPGLSFSQPNLPFLVTTKPPHPNPAQRAPETREGTVTGRTKVVSLVHQTSSTPSQSLPFSGEG